MMPDKIESWRRGVTIGIPLHNEYLFVEAAIRSAAPQCEVLMISDNGSTDSSASVCEALAREYDNILFVKQPRNLGATANFKYLLDKATTPFFMWLGAHDMIPHGYVETLKARLESDHSVVLVFGDAQHIDRDGKSTERYVYAFSTEVNSNDPKVRILALIRNLSDCSLIHGLFRRDILLKAWIPHQCLGADHVLLVKTALEGKLAYVPNVSLIRRDVHLADTHAAQLKRITGQRWADQRVQSHRDMQRHQYELAVQASLHQGWRGVVFLLKSRYWLVSRFGGPFGGHALVGVYDHLVCAILQFKRTVVLIIR